MRPYATAGQAMRPYATAGQAIPHYRHVGPCTHTVHHPYGTALPPCAVYCYRHARVRCTTCYQHRVL